MKYHCCSIVVAKVGVLLVSILRPGVSGYDLGASCEYDEDCIAEHSYCQMQRTCQCKRGFKAANDGSTCLATVGATCRSRYDCATLPHSDCFQDVCQCEPNFVPDLSGSQCLPRVRELRESCLQDNQCQASFGDQSRCVGGRCECMIRFHFLNGRCYLTRDINDICSNSSECFIGPEFTSTIECRDQRCQCVRGYYLNEYRKCIRSLGTQKSTCSMITVTVGLSLVMFSSNNFLEIFFHI